MAALLVHEMGHAVAARAFGTRALQQSGPAGADGRPTALPTITLLVVWLAGAAASLATGVATFEAMRVLSLSRTAAAGGLVYFGWINLGWGLLNLLPILPLDAGFALAAVLEKPTRGKGELVVRVVSIAPALALVLVALSSKLPLPAAVFALMALANVRAAGVAFERSARNGRARTWVRVGASRGVRSRVFLELFW